jgi:dienelactone hydrolase
MGILWARAGAAVLIMDQVGSGERLQNYPWNREAYHSRYIMGMQLHLAGESLIGWMVWDIMRGIDLLTARPEVDPAKIILLGAVAGGGDPAAVAAALDPRIAAVAPFNFGESTPESPRFLPDRNRVPQALADPGSGSWETTRALRGSIAGQFLPWLICASVAPRRFIYSFEMGWNVEELPAWKRYNKVFDLYGARDNLDEAHGFGTFPGPGECTNIGPAQRKTLYPELEKWFGIPVPATEPQDRRPESELAALTPAVASKLAMRPVHQLALAGISTVKREAGRDWIEVRWREKLGDIEPNRTPPATSYWRRPMLGADAEGVTLAVEPGITVPVVMLRPGAVMAGGPVVVIVSEQGKGRILTDRRREIEALLKAGFAVCLPDVRGTGESAPDTRRGPQSAGISLAATELMLGNTLLGARLKDLRSVIAWLGSRPIVMWGDSHAPPNPARMMLDELPNWQIGPQIQNQAEPLGGLLAILAAFYERRVRAVAVHRGLASYRSILEDNFAYVPADIIVPGILEAGDIADVAAALAPRPVVLDEMVDGRNRLVPGARRGIDIAAWIIGLPSPR